MLCTSEAKQLLLYLVYKFPTLVRNDNFTAPKPRMKITINEWSKQSHSSSLYLQKRLYRKKATPNAVLSFSASASGHLLK